MIRRGDSLLLLNRQSAPYMGSWNGVGGKIEAGESEEAGVLREVLEETGIALPGVRYKGLVTWTIDGGRYGGMHAFLSDLPEDFLYATPIATDEGILDWKRIEWIMHPANQGVAHNLPHFLKRMLEDDGLYDHQCVFTNGALVSVQSVPLQTREKARA
ncbi:NUDIX hydrolase [Paenibacillus sp. MBLB4367]|uniref:NUDIX hydrolase n=1 Tax=Paenibacillus sp. MBLB4367 TaxID=3384767 RepID=UPI0039082E3C